MFGWFKKSTAISNTVAFATNVMKLFEQYEITDQNTRNAVIDTLVAVISQHKVDTTVVQAVA